MSKHQELTFCIDSEKELLEQLKIFEAKSTDRLSQGFEDGRTVRELVMARARHIDLLLVNLWQYLEVPVEYSFFRY